MLYVKARALIEPCISRETPNKGAIGLEQPSTACIQPCFMDTANAAGLKQQNNRYFFMNCSGDLYAWHEAHSFLACSFVTLHV